MDKQSTTHTHILIGHNIDNVIHIFVNPIMVVQPVFQTQRHFLFTYDVSPATNKVLRLIARSPQLRELECDLAMVAELTDEHKRQLVIVTQVLKSAGIQVEAKQLPGKALPVICQHAT
ncbi:hypothetical protein [Aeromonas hydrophila]|uniref:hypothetical protein n=1 Tax=Aeromonas hydrophila TaxID=644 RepID=UPI003EC6D49D